MQFEKRLIFHAILCLCRIGNGLFAAVDWKRGAYWMASSVCIVSVSCNVRALRCDLQAEKFRILAGPL